MAVDVGSTDVDGVDTCKVEITCNLHALCEAPNDHIPERRSYLQSPLAMETPQRIGFGLVWRPANEKLWAS